jgi:hypothetical protein
MRVCIVNAGQDIPIQDYPTDQYMIDQIQTDSDIPVNIPKSFNISKEELAKDFDIIGFVDYTHSIIRDDALSQILQIFRDYPEINGVFADVMKIYPDGISVPLQHPSSFLGMCDSHYINSPFFIRTMVEHTFNTNIVHSYMFDFIKRVNEKYCTWHVPEPIFAKDMSIASEEQELREALGEQGR